MANSAASTFAAKARGRTKRALLSAPVVRQWSETKYEAQRGRHLASLPWLSRDRFELVAELRQNGLARRDLSGELSDEMLSSIDRFVTQLRADTSSDSSIMVSPADMEADLTLFKLGLCTEILDMAEVYLGLPVHYLGVGVRRERADSVTAGVRQWHMDIEDRSMLKAIVYLVDVDSDGGPFEYLDLPQTRLANQKLKYRSGFVDDSALEAVVPSADWHQATGPRLSAIFVDTCRVFHRARPPRSTDRYSMTFSYSSVRPYQVFPEYLLSVSTLAQLRPELTPQQRQALKLD